MDLLGTHYPIVLSQAIIWGDMDAYNHVNNTVYFRYFEDARVAYFHRVGIHEYMNHHNIGPILANTECNFRRPLIYPDTIRIATNCEILSEKKFGMTYRIFSEQQKAIVADGSGVIVYYDYTINKSCEIPETVKLAMQAVEDFDRDNRT